MQSLPDYEVTNDIQDLVEFMRNCRRGL